MPERWLEELERYRSIDPPTDLWKRIEHDLTGPRPDRAFGVERGRAHRVIAGAVALVLAAAGTTFLLRSFATAPQRQPLAEGPVANGKIAFVSEGGIHLVNPDGTGLTEIRPGDLRSFDTQPMWSPDGTKIAFLHAAEGRFELLVYDLASGGISTIAGRGYDVDSPRWSPDGKRIAFVSGNDIFIIGMAAGAEPIELTSGAFPTWSPDGARIAFETRVGVSVIDADGSHGSSLAAGTFPEWSPDGSAIAFIDDRLRLSLISPDGTGLMRLTDAGFDDIGPPMWSPDGSQIAFEASKGGNYDIYVVNRDGSSLNNLTADPRDENVPTWSPDGTKIAFIAGEAVAGNPAARSTFDLYVVDADGTNRTRLTTGAMPAYALSWQALRS
jgi:Tol biopolymer transport system component